MKKNKGYKIESYSTRSSSTKKKKKIRNTVIFVLVLALLGFVGYSISEPLSNLISGKKTPQKNNTSSLISSSAASSEKEEEQKETEIPDVNAAYLPLNTALDTASLNAFIAQIKNQGFNAAVIELKDQNGNIFYNSSLEAVEKVKAKAQNTVDVENLITAFKQNGIVPIAEINAFRDSIGTKNAKAKIGYQGKEGWSWLDGANGKPWLNPYSAEAQNYISDIACELADLGFERIMVSSVMFPAVFEIRGADFGALEATVSHAEMLSKFTETLKQKINAKNAIMLLKYDEAQAIRENNVVYGGADPITFSADVYVPSLLASAFSGKLELASGSVDDFSADIGAGTSLLVSEIKNKTPTIKIMPVLSGKNDGSDTALSVEQIEICKNACIAQMTAGYYIYDKNGDYAS